MALYQGLLIAKERSLFHLEIDTDGTQVIKFIKEECITYDSIICSCGLLLSQMGTVVMQYNFRQENEVAHLLAKHAKILTTFNNVEFLYFPLPFVMARMLANEGRNVYVRIVSIATCSHLARIGNQYAIHGLSTTSNNPQDHIVCNP